MTALLAVAVLLGIVIYEVLGGSVQLGNIFGGTLTAAEIRQYAANAGFSGDDLDTATAIAQAESSGKPTAYNPETDAGAPEGKGSYGLWQIYLNAHPEFAGLNLKDPQVNANAAYEIYAKAGYSFAPWSTFNSGAYARYLTGGALES